MPRPRKHANAADRQKAYRERKEAHTKEVLAHIPTLAKNIHRHCSAEDRAELVRLLTEEQDDQISAEHARLHTAYAQLAQEQQQMQQKHRALQERYARLAQENREIQTAYAAQQQEYVQEQAAHIAVQAKYAQLQVEDRRRQEKLVQMQASLSVVQEAQRQKNEQYARLEEAYAHVCTAHEQLRQDRMHVYRSLTEVQADYQRLQNDVRAYHFWLEMAVAAEYTLQQFPLTMLHHYAAKHGRDSGWRADKDDLVRWLLDCLLPRPKKWSSAGLAVRLLRDGEMELLLAGHWKRPLPAEG
jgi:chromosome segregation ATPase